MFWIYLALSGYIGLPVAAALPLSAVLFAYLALYIAAVCALIRYFAAVGKTIALCAGAACWTLAEGLREVALTGFPWFAAGYSQVPGGFFVGFAPLGGIALITFALMLSAALLAASWQAKVQMHRRIVALVAVCIIIIGGEFTRRVEWTAAGEEITISLLQGNVKQKIKWQTGAVEQALADYLQMAIQAKGRIIILPETALPMIKSDLPRGYADILDDIATARNGAIIAGMFEKQNGKTYNAAVAFGDFAASSYRKRHLTPYGEYLPFAEITAPFLQREWMAFFALSPGVPDTPLTIPFANIGIAICYEDIFGGELRTAMAQADFLANLTNDGWFDGSMMAAQHLRYSQTRALESAKDIVRATNTGISAIINHRGKIISRLPPQTTAVLEGAITTRTGKTPYSRYGDTPILIIAILLLIAITIRTAVILALAEINNLLVIPA